MRARLAFIASAVLMASTTACPAEAEQRRGPDRQVELPADAGLVVGHQARQGRAVLVELVPPGETVQRFTRMVTLQSLVGLAHVPQQQVLDRFSAQYRAKCPRGVAAPFGVEGRFDGVRIDCPLHPATGRMETVFARLVDLSPNMAMVQITMTRVPTPEESRWARDYLAHVTVR